VFDAARSHVRKDKDSNETGEVGGSRMVRAASVGMIAWKTGDEVEAELVGNQIGNNLALKGSSANNDVLNFGVSDVLLPTLAPEIKPDPQHATDAGILHEHSASAIRGDDDDSDVLGSSNSKVKAAMARAKRVSGERRQSFFVAPMTLSKNTTKNEWSDFGAGDFRRPSFVVRMRRDGSSICQLVYRSHKVYAGKPDLDLSPDFPRVRCLGPAAATTLVVTLHDQLAHLVVDLVYTVLHDTNAICRRTVVRNMGLNSKSAQDVVEIQRVMSATVDLEGWLSVTRD
jgi:hypothetical protein